MNPIGTEAPVAAAEYVLCPEANAPYNEIGCVSGHREGRDITRLDEIALPSDGAWRLRVALRDAAENFDLDRGADVDGLRLDTLPPEAAFLPLAAETPTQVRLAVSDATSGLAGAEVEARRLGDVTWRTLRTELTDRGAVAAVPDEILPDGTYELRAHVVDRAGNQRTLTTLGDGTQMSMTLPLREASRLLAGQPVRRGKARHRTVLEPRPHARFGSSVQLHGSVHDVAGKPRGGAQVRVLERVDLPGMPWRQVASLHTSSKGAFSYRASPGPARTLRFRYDGSATSRPAEADVELRVRADSTLVPDRTRVRNGDSVVFRGRLRGRPLPARGKLLALQAFTARGWRTFATPRASESDGRWRYRYRFTGTTATVRYSFRVVIPRESSYPYAAGSSRVAKVLVRG